MSYVISLYRHPQGYRDFANRFMYHLGGNRVDENYQRKKSDSIKARTLASNSSASKKEIETDKSA